LLASLKEIKKTFNNSNIQSPYRERKHKFIPCVRAQLRVVKNVIPEESCFNPAQCLIVTGCFQHDRLVVHPSLRHYFRAGFESATRKNLLLSASGFIKFPPLPHPLGDSLNNAMKQ